VDDYTFFGTADGIRWAERRRELDSLIAQGLALPEIADELKAMRIPAIEVARAVGDQPGLLARYRAVRDWSNRLGSAFERQPGRRWFRRLPPWSGLPGGVLVLMSYLLILWEALPRMPLLQQLFSLAGLVCVLVLSGGIATEDVLVMRRAIRVVRDRFDLDEQVLTDIVLPELRQYMAELRKPVYGSKLPVDRTYLDNDGHEAPTVVTSAGHELRKILGRPTVEAVAIAGPRGVGKTTTIRAVSEGVFSDPDAPPPLAVVASAPSRYEARDFVLHLHVLLCQKVIALTSACLLLPRQRRRGSRRWAPRPILWLAMCLMLPASMGGLAILLWPRSLQELGSSVWQRVITPGGLTFDATTGGREQPALIIAVLAAMIVVWLLSMVLIFGGGAAARLRVRRRLRRKRYPGLRRLRGDAFEQLRGIRFLQTYTSGWSGKIGLPIGSDAGWSASVQRAEQNRTHPEVVENFRRFAERSAAALISAGLIERLVIAIDELDKIAEPAQAHELVNDIKGIFEIPNCQFLVSVSEDAMSAFERRGIPVRDAFDSAFTQMVRMDHFTLAESRRWLSRRLLGVPEQFAFLLHCLSGGLPRELRRVTIELVDIVAEDECGDLAHVTGVLLDRELDRKAHAFVAAARQFDDTAELSEYLADLVTMPQARTPAEQTALAAKLKPGEKVTELRRVRWQSACFLLFCATVLQIFDDTLDEAGLGKGLESLALARIQLAVDPQVAWRLVESVRAASDL
jgi:DNA polymerase III delta prime subunit